MCIIVNGVRNQTKIVKIMTDILITHKVFDW